MDRGAWWATVLGVTELDMTEQMSTCEHCGSGLQRIGFLFSGKLEVSPQGTKMCSPPSSLDLCMETLEETSFYLLNGPFSISCLAYAAGGVTLEPTTVERRLVCGEFVGAL